MATRAHPDEIVNGDGWSIWRHDRTWRILLVDGLGHGPLAAAATRGALAAAEENRGAEPSALMQALHRALTHTRGAAASLVDLAAGGTLTFVGVGNVDAHLWAGRASSHLTPLRGILGVAVPTLRPQVISLVPGWRLALFTDGVSARFCRAPEMPAEPVGVQMVADRILAGWGRQTDDGTVIVVADAGT